MLTQKFLSLDSKLSKVSEGKKAHLLSILPERIRIKLAEELPARTLCAPMTIEKITRRVDISHFKAYLKTLPKAEQEFFIAAFPKYQRPTLTDEKVTDKSFKSEKFANHVMLTFFKKALKNFPPPTILPFHPMVELLADSGIHLSKLIHYLGLLDVASEVKQIISQETLKKLQALFDSEEVTFMNKMAHDTRPILSSMNLSAYDGNKEKLEALIEERGLYRFCQGVKSAPSQYRFFFTYFLPKRLSEQMEKLLNQKPKFALSYRNWEEDTLNTWRFLCTYSK